MGPSVTHQGAKLLGSWISGEPKFDGGNPNFGQGFPKGNPEIARFKHFTPRLDVIQLFIMFSETLKKLWKSEFFKMGFRTKSNYFS